jgi:hypothetical protein
MIAAPVTISALLVSGCGSDSKPSAPPPPSAAPTAAATSPAPTPTASADTAAIKRIVLKDSDLPGSGFTADKAGVTPDKDGTSLAQPSFDYCGGHFPSEAKRTGRLLVTADGKLSGKDASIASEVVQYQSPSDASNALNEFKDAVENCDGGSHPTALNDGKPLTFTPGEKDSNLQNIPKPNYLVVTKLSDGSTTAYLGAADGAEGRLRPGELPAQHVPD